MPLWFISLRLPDMFIKNYLVKEEGEESSTLLDDTGLNPDDTGLDETDASEQEYESDSDTEPWTDDTDSEDD